jgi:hypothetical protein
LYRYFVSQSSEFCRRNPFCCFSTSVCCFLFRYRLSPETFGRTLVCGLCLNAYWHCLYSCHLKQKPLAYTSVTFAEELLSASRFVQPISPLLAEFHGNSVPFSSVLCSYIPYAVICEQKFSYLFSERSWWCHHCSLVS